MKEYKANPSAFKGNISDTTNAIRVGITGLKQTPDLYEILNLLGKETVLARLKKAVESL